MKHLNGKTDFLRLCFTLLLIALASGSLGGCLAWRSPRQPEVNLPGAWQNSDFVGQFPDTPWWPALGDTTLNQLMNEAFAGNLTFAQAAFRLDQSRALYSIEKSSLLPGLTGSIRATSSGDIKDKPAPAVPSMIPESPDFLSSLSAAYEIDLWGKLRAGRKAAYSDLLADQNNLQALIISLSGQVARTYYRIIELQAQSDLLKQTIISYSNSCDLVEARYQRGLTPSLDVYQAETALAGARARAAIVSGELLTVKNSLALLLGHYPGPETDITINTLPDSLPPVAPDLPSLLLERRPDVRAAFCRLLAADYRSAGAAAARFPSFSLTTTISGSNDNFSETINPDNMIWNAIGNLVMPIFDSGRRRANARGAEAAWQVNKALFGETVLRAVQEVENALIAGRSQRVYLIQLSAQVQAAEATLRLARDRYLQGTSDYLPVIYAQTSSFNASSNHITARRGQVDAYISLVTALGGGWTDQVLIDSDRVSKLHNEIR